MLYALINGKLDLQSNKYIKEDSCTAAFFGPLLHLPDELIFKIIKEASSAGLPEHGGRLISFEFWPHWDGADTDNSRYVEPDLYLEFEHCALIVEAKFNSMMPEVPILFQGGDEWHPDMLRFAWVQRTLLSMRIDRAIRKTR